MVLARFVVGTLAIAQLLLGSGAAYAQDYPNRVIRIVAGSIGGGLDFVARIVAQGITGPLGQPVIIDNRPTAITGEVVSKAPPDGYTLLIAGGAFPIGPLLRKMPYDPVKDFSPIILVCQESNVLVVHPSVPAKSVKELIALAKARPGELNYSSGGAGGTAHLAAELFKVLTGVNIVGIPYKSNTAELADLLGGHVQLTFGSVVQMMPHVKLGKLRGLGVTSLQPSALVPGLPTVASTVPKFEMVTRTAMFAPAKTPVAIINRLNQEIARALNQPDAKEKFLSAGQEIVGSSPEELAAAMKSYIAAMAKVIADAGIKTD